MTIEEYTEKLDAIEKQYAIDRSKIAKEYAISNAKFKIGDIIQDPYTDVIIKIEVIKWRFGFNSDLPHCFYVGYEFKKDLTTKKNNKKAEIYPNRPIVLLKSN